MVAIAKTTIGQLTALKKRTMASLVEWSNNKEIESTETSFVEVEDDGSMATFSDEMIKETMMRDITHSASSDSDSYISSLSSCWSLSSEASISSYEGIVFVRERRISSEDEGSLRLCSNGEKDSENEQGGRLVHCSESDDDGSLASFADDFSKHHHHHCISRYSSVDHGVDDDSDGDDYLHDNDDGSSYYSSSSDE